MQENPVDIKATLCIIHAIYNPNLDPAQEIWPSHIT